MGDEDRGGQLPQRVPDAARPGLPPPAEPERTEPERVVTTEPRRVVQPGPRAEPESRAEPRAVPGRPVHPERPANAGPVAEDEVTEWLEGAAGPRPAVRLRPGQRGPSPHGTAGPVPPGRFLALLAVLLVTAFAAGSLAVVAVRHFTRPQAGRPATGGASAALPRQEAAVRGEAAAWVAQQVSHGVIVACDRVMCAALTARGFPADQLLMLGPASPDPMNAAVVVETAAVRDLFGSSLAAAWAPAVLASFGSGPAGITVRVTARHGAAAYQTALAAGLAARMTAGAALLKDRRITVAPLAGVQLTSGQVDSRLLRALAALARHQQVSIVRFGNAGSGASAGVPLRFADLAETDQAAHLTSAAYVRSARAYLNTVNARFRPARTTTLVLPGGQAVLRVEFTAPSPVGVSGP
jgi:hypothetical protein